LVLSPKCGCKNDKINAVEHKKLFAIFIDKKYLIKTGKPFSVWLGASEARFKFNYFCAI
jgi:hypothetical protein